MRRTLLLSAGAAVVLFALAAVAGVGRPSPARGAAAGQPSVVTTSGHGDVTAVPDQAVVTAGVNTRAATASDALSQNAQAMQQVIAALKKAGGTDLQTQEVSLEPQTDEQGTVTGYVAQNTVSAKAAIADAGALVDAAVAAGANTVEGPSLAVSDSDALYRKALADAMTDARAKAAALAQAGGFSVGAVYAVTEQGAQTPPPVVFEPATAAKAEATPVEPGTQDVTADVTVSFRIG
ncbi:MAG TPA: SIMPL domain-containing protein [Gaiellaceae bacterium]|jgi:hypothetical protein